MSIGVLGFIVWSHNFLAFLVGDYKVINSTVGWNSYLFLFLFTITSISFKALDFLGARYTKLGNLLDTFYSLNSSKNLVRVGKHRFLSIKNVHHPHPQRVPKGEEARNAQSAGNLCLLNKEVKEGSSETIRGNTYDLFKFNFAYYFKEEFKQDNNWLSWFIGFLEGDGAILENKGRSYFVLTQKDDTVLHEIYETLKIGKVKHFYDNKGNRKYSRYIVSENKGIFLLYLLLNGNLVLQSRVNQLTKWNIALNNASKFDYSLFCTKEVPMKIEILKEPTLNDAWLSGFTDAEGCFSVKISNAKASFYVSVLFILETLNREIERSKDWGFKIGGPGRPVLKPLSLKEVFKREGLDTAGRAPTLSIRGASGLILGLGPAAPPTFRSRTVWT